jgi:hypothetical protein
MNMQGKAPKAVGTWPKVHRLHVWHETRVTILPAGRISLRRSVGSSGRP